ncbi:hypothetical protein R1sor_027118 [Riccia sorocarpa]|uniref:Uncharacterized protein n=1 Tax=Riccia sorocarpa TaxID=122646 RepID=A0ABD3GGL5_9MARC
MWNYMLNLFYERRQSARAWPDELTEYAKKRMSEFDRECGRFVAMSADENKALVQTDGGLKQWRLTKLPTRKSIRNGRQRIVRIPNGGSTWSVQSEYTFPIHDEPTMNPAVMNVSQQYAMEGGNPPVTQSSARPVARSRGTRCYGACKRPRHTRRTCPALRQYIRDEVQEGVDVAADG